MAATAHRTDIDGLRALAVLPVVLFHSGLDLLSGGYVGVDIFFVISGYVIAKTLLEDLQAGQYSIWRFYAKRIRRIFPALFATIITTFAVAWFMLLPQFFESFAKSIVATSMFMSNLFFWKDSGYFSAAALSRPLLHTWSLAVEEQYYIFAPIGIWLIYTYLGQRWRLWLVPALLASLALSIYATTQAPTANFFLLPTRAWELLLGAVLALAPPRAMTSRPVNEAIAATGLVAILYAVLTYSDATPFPGLNAIAPCAGAAMIIYAGLAPTPTLVGRMLSLKPMQFVGLISYSMYLVHWPVIVFFYFHYLAEPTGDQVVLILLIVFALATLSWKYIEQPFRGVSVTTHRAHILTAGVATILLCIALGMIGVMTKGAPSRFPDYQHIEIAGGEQWNRGTCFQEGNPDPQKWDAAACTITAAGNKTMLLWGDSFAAQYVPGLVKLHSTLPYQVIQYTAAGCPPVLSYRSFARLGCTDFNARALNIIRDHKVDTVVLAARWTDMQSRGLGELTSTLTALRTLGVETIVIGQSPQFSIDVQVIGYAKGDRTGKGIDKWHVFFDPSINRELAAVVGAGATFIDPMPFMCDNPATGTGCPYRDAGDYLYADYGHYSAAGSNRAVQAYFPGVKGR